MLLPNGIEYAGIFKKGYIEGAGTVAIDGVYHKGKYMKGIFQGDLIFTTQNNQHIVFKTKQEKKLLIGQVDIYLSSGYVLKQAKYEKNKILNG